MDTRVLAVDAEGSVLFGGTAAPRPLPGLGAGVVTAHSRMVRPDQVLRVSGRDCVVGARLLARPSFARAVDGGHPYRHYFPLGAPDRD